MQQLKNNKKLIGEEIREIIGEIMGLNVRKDKDTLKKRYNSLLKKIIKKLEKINFSELNEEEFLQPNGLGEAIAKGIYFKRTQLRKFFMEVKNIKLLIEREGISKVAEVKVIGLIPKLAYAKGRKLIDENFYQFMRTILKKLSEDLSKENFEKFEKIFEAIVAYHTYYNPKGE